MVFRWLTVVGVYGLRGVLQCSSEMQARRLIALVNMDINNAGLELILKPIWERTYIHMYCMFGFKDTNTVLVVRNGKKIINIKSLHSEYPEVKEYFLKPRCINVPADCVCSKDFECVSEAGGGVRPFVSRGWMVRMLLSRDTSSEVNIVSLREQCVWVQGVNVCVLCLLMHKRLCVSMCTCLHALGGVTHSTKWIPVDRHFQDRSLWTESAEGRKMMRRRVGGCWPMGSSREGAAC